MDADALLGAWEQVATDAGACPTCRIADRAAGADIAVTANNGWAATLPEVRGGEIVGAGRWAAGLGFWGEGRPFAIRFRMDGDGLVMTMTVETGTGRARVVRARYRRAWQGV